MSREGFPRGIRIRTGRCRPRNRQVCMAKQKKISFRKYLENSVNAELADMKKLGEYTFRELMEHNLCVDILRLDAIKVLLEEEYKHRSEQLEELKAIRAPKDVVDSSEKVLNAVKQAIDSLHW